jgi:Ca-activated chloride channel family protein
MRTWKFVLPGGPCGLVPRRIFCSLSLLASIAVVATVAVTLAHAAPLAAPPAQDQTHVQLILDASASMWNKLEDGRYRIVAAKEVLNDFIGGLPDNPGLNVGLRVYGSQVHFKEDGACEDTRLFVPMQGVDRAEMLSVVKSAKAIGSTPLAMSILAAADDFPAQGEKLIVVVTDGEEACGGDLQAAVARLREAGVNIDLRIIGIDLSDEAVARFQDVAQIENASSARDLAGALGRAVAEVVDPEPEALTVDVRVLRHGVPAEGALGVSFIGTVSEESHPLQPAEPGHFTGEIPAGSYRARIEEEGGERGAWEFAGLLVAAGEGRSYQFEIGNEVEVDLQLLTTEPGAGSQVVIRYQGAPGTAGQWVSLAIEGTSDDQYLDWGYVEGSSGEVAIRSPEEVLSLEARFYLPTADGGALVVGRSEPFETQPVSASLEVAETINAGATFEVAWTGPDNEGDYITIVEAGAAEGAYGSFAYTFSGSPIRINAPETPGEHEVRYVTGQTDRTLASVTVEIVAVDATVQAPATVNAGAELEVEWTGPDNNGDYITIVEAGAAEGTYGNYTYTQRGSPLAVTAPDAPGEYEVRYLTGGSNTTLARQAVTVLEVSATLEAPAEVAAGEALQIAWTGPDNSGDYITIVEAGAAEGSYGAYEYTNRGSPLTIQAPETPGEYEIRYIVGQSSRTLERRSITVR